MTLLERIVGDDEVGQRLGQLLAAWLGESRSRAQIRIAEGRVTVDGEALPKSHRVQAGQRVVVADDPPSEPPVLPRVPVRFEDAHLAVVAKPPDLVVHAGAGVRGGTLVEALHAQGMALAPAADQADRPGIVHRLDRGTSGLLVVAKTASALQGLQALLREHDVHREYWALVEGHPDPPAASIDAPIARSRRNRTIFVTSDRGRRAVSHYRTLVAHADTAELAVTLETGRTHQVRVHLSAIGRPVAGDIAYGADAGRSRRLGLTRPALHAWRIAFTHPVTGETVDLTEPLPADLRAAAARAG